MRARGCLFTIIFLVGLSFTSIFAQHITVPKSEIYAMLDCCDCNVPFEKCSCAEAIEMKAYIDGLLESGLNKEDIFYRIAKKFSLNVILDPEIKSLLKQRLVKDAGINHPAIFLESDYFDFGQVSKGKGKISKVFKLSNKGNANLIIKNIKTFCPCASVSLKINKYKSHSFGVAGSPKDWQAEIKPGERAELKLIVDFASSYVSLGKLIRTATIISNDPVYPELEVKIEAEVKE